MPFQKIELPIRGEWRGGFTVGTLSLIRREALERAGMWAPWCLTEDSELAIRIHALGYGSYNLERTFGRGLIPEDFARYRRQCFRWTAGPVQQLRRYWRLLMPLRGQAHGGLDRRQRLLELHHGLEPVQAALALSAMAALLAQGAGRHPTGGRACTDLVRARWLGPAYRARATGGRDRAAGNCHSRDGAGVPERACACAGG